MKWMCPIHALIVPNGCSPVQRRKVMRSGSRPSRCRAASTRGEVVRLANHLSEAHHTLILWGTYKLLLEKSGFGRDPPLSRCRAGRSLHPAMNDWSPRLLRLPCRTSVRPLSALCDAHGSQFRCSCTGHHTASTTTLACSPPRAAKARWRQVRTRICWSWATRWSAVNIASIRSSSLWTRASSRITGT